MLYLNSIVSNKEVSTISNFKSKKIFLICLILFFISSINVYADNIITAELNMSNSYLEWQNLSDEEKQNIPMPSMYSIDMPDEIIQKETNKVDFSKIIRSHTYSLIQNPVTSNNLSSRYNLNDYYEIDVRNQEMTECCWAVALLNSMELNIQVTDGKITNYSERHMDYATSEDFYDYTNPNAFKRSVREGGNSVLGLAYLTNGQGAVLEEEMPFKNDLSKISLSEIDIAPTTYVTGYANLPGINKYYNNDGSVVYFSSTGDLYTDEEVKVIRDNIKKHIVNYGGIVTYTAATEYDYYSSPDVISSKAYYCNDITASFDHAVTIVGWDDNYSKENFTGKAKPTKDGAYIVLNSYSEDAFEDGYIYISYEDVWVESTLYGITETSEIDYDYLYQYDNYGGALALTLYNEKNEVPDTIFYASIYSKESNEVEKLNAVSVNSNKYCDFEVYVNPNGTDLNIDNMIKVATTDTLAPGYHKIEFDGVELKENEFAIVIKEKSIDGNATLMIEPQIDGTFFEYVDAEVGKSQISVNGKNWQNLSDLGVINLGGVNIDTNKSDVCIKAFTNKVEEVSEEPVNPDESDDTDDNEEPEEPSTPDDENKPENVVTISSEKYNITNDKYITKIYVGTKLTDLLKDITITKEYKIFDKDNNEITDLNTLAQTNMYLQIENEKYYIVVRADVNGDGKISLIDLSRQLAYIAELNGFKLEGAYLLACDLSLDGKVSLIDLSQFIVLFNSL